MHYAILAAGQGSRLKQEGVTTPKPLVCLDGGVTLMERLIGIFRRRPDCEGVSIVINPEVKARAEADGGALPWRDASDVIVASTPGSMHSLHRLAPTLRGCRRFCLTTVDTVFRPDEFDRYIDACTADCGTDGYMGVTTYVDDEKPLYVAADSEEIITGYFDTPVPGARYVSGGIYTLPSAALDVLDECMDTGATRMRDLQRALVASGMRLRAYPFTCIIDVDHPADIGKANSLLTSDTDGSRAEKI